MFFNCDMKRGISPIISIIIIIGLVVAIAGLVVVWGNDFVRGIISDSSSESNQKLTCATAVDLKMVSSCYQEDEVVFTIESKGETDVKKFLVSLIGDDSETVEVRGLRAFGLDTFSVDTNDVVNTGFNFLGLNDIRVVPYIEKEGVEYVCDNYILKDNQISCCVGHCLAEDPGNTCNDNNDCEGVDNYCCTSGDPNPPCSRVGECVGCLDDNQCPSDEPFCISNECEECRNNNDCGSNEICDNNECVQQSSSQVNCDDVSYNIVVHVNGNNDVCKRDSDIYITISSTGINNVNGFTFRLNGDQGFTREFTKTGTGTFVFRYGFGTDTIQTNEIINSITVIPSVSVGYESCVSSRTQTVSLGCCQTFATCSELDCGKNPYINGDTNDGSGTVPDGCDSISTMKEYYCDLGGTRQQEDGLPCGGDLCSGGATECTF